MRRRRVVEMAYECDFADVIVIGWLTRQKSTTSRRTLHLARRRVMTSAKMVGAFSMRTNTSETLQSSHGRTDNLVIAVLKSIRRSKLKAVLNLICGANHSESSSKAQPCHIATTLFLV